VTYNEFRRWLEAQGCKFQPAPRQPLQSLSGRKIQHIPDARQEGDQQGSGASDQEGPGPEIAAADAADKAHTGGSLEIR
jgi:hypothetical protein